MKIVCNKKECCGCGACQQICPKKCITMEKDMDGFLYPTIDGEKCVNCRACQKVCPILRNKGIEEERTPTAYAAYCNDDLIRANSSSGGVFTLLALKTLEKGGVVFGAAMTQDGTEVYHMSIDCPECIGILQGSKYVQSQIGNCFQEAKDYLDSGKKVLFSGTPCEIEGLKSFLPKEYSNLICVDVICHGCPSPNIWKKYIANIKDRASSEVAKINFRNKSRGWKEYDFSVSFSNGDVYEENHCENAYMKVFLSDLCLRESCYACKFKKRNRVSDITLADLWGSDIVCPELDDNKGLSFVSIHSLKGVNLFHEISPELTFKRIDYEKAVAYNPSMIKSAQKNIFRGLFLQGLRNTKVGKFDVYVKGYGLICKALRKLYM